MRFVSTFTVRLDRHSLNIQLSHAVNAAILLSAWSAASSDIYISSRFLFFLARRGHAPSFLAHLFRYPSTRPVRSSISDSDSNTDEDDEGTWSDSDRDSDGGHDDTGLRENELLGGEHVQLQPKHTYVMPLASVLVSASVGMLTFLSYRSGSSAQTVFNWLVSVASVASLQSWAGMLFTYIRCVLPPAYGRLAGSCMCERGGVQVASRDGVL